MMGKVFGFITPNIQEFFKNIGIGEGSNRLKIEDDGTIVREGNATVWDDIVGSLIGKRLSSVVGKVEYNYAENAITFKSGGSISTANDIVNFNLQYPHAAKVTGSMNLHIHWEQSDTYLNMPIQFTVKYRVQSNGAAKTTSWTTVVVEANPTNNAMTYVSGTFNQITKLINVDMTGMGISSTAQFQLARTDSETGDIIGTFVDAHVEMDTDGSRSEFSK